MVMMITMVTMVILGWFWRPGREQGEYTYGDDGDDDEDDFDNLAVSKVPSKTDARRSPCLPPEDHCNLVQINASLQW